MPLPAIHKSPYFNTWFSAYANVSTPNGSLWPQFFRSHDLGWFLAIRANGTGYRIQGDNSKITAASAVGTYVSPTRTVITVDAGPVRANLTYLTPIELNDWTLHTFPFAYLAIDIWSRDGNPYPVQVYSDVTGQFLSSNWGSNITWNTTMTSKSIYHQAQQINIRQFEENFDMSEDGTQYFGFTATPGVSVTWESNSPSTRLDFNTAGNLTNTSDTNYRTISDDWPTMALALDVGNITKTSNSLVFALGLVRDPVMAYRKSDATHNMSPLWSTRWKDIGDAIDDFLLGFPSALSRSIAVDNKIMSDAAAASSMFNLPSTVASDLMDLAALNLRQTVGSLELTASSTSSNGQSPSMDDIRVFMKDVGSSARVNPVETIYASFPAFLYLNTSLAGKLLEPLLEFQASPSLYSQAYAAPDLGSFWPTVRGNNTDQASLAIQSCGSMLIMALAHLQKSGDGALVYTYYTLLSRWADFLVNNTMNPSGYATADGLIGAGTSNLVLKGIMGIYAMGKINQMLEVKGADPQKTSQYLTTASDYVQQWKSSEAFAPDHAVSRYGVNSSWSMLYDLYAPRLVGADIIPNNIYDMQAAWYASQSRTSAPPFGLPFDSTDDTSVTKAHWSLLTAGSIFNDTTSGARDALISAVHTRISLKKTIPNPSTYDASDGKAVTGTAGPAMGAAFAFHALTLPDVKPTFPAGSFTGSTSKSKSALPIIVGGTLGGIFAILIASLGLYLWLRRRRGKNQGDFTDIVDLSESQTFVDRSYLVTPFTVDPNRPPTSELSTVNRDKLAPLTRDASSLSNEKGTLSSERSDLSVRGPGSVANHSISSGTINDRGRTPSQGQDDWRRELEDLRNEVVALRGHQQISNEPPPMYVDETNL